MVKLHSKQLNAIGKNTIRIVWNRENSNRISILRRKVDLFLFLYSNLIF